MFRTYKNCICIKGGNNDNSARILKLSAFGGQTEATHWLRPTAKHTQRGHQRGEILLGQARDGPSAKANSIQGLPWAALTGSCRKAAGPGGVAARAGVS